MSLQKNALFPLPAFASVLFLLSLIYLVIVWNRDGRNKRAAKILLGISAMLGLASTLTYFASAKALEGANEIFGGGTEVMSGMLLGVLLCVAAAIHILIAGYIGCGWLDRAKGGPGSNA